METKEKETELNLYKKQCKDGKERWFWCAIDKNGNKVFGLVPGYYEISLKKKEK